MNPLLSIVHSQFSTPQYLIKNLLWRMPRTVCDLPVVFVIGAPRSGTTLLQRILGGHSGFFSIPGETGLFSWQNIFTRQHFGLSAQQNQMLFDESKDIIEFFARGVSILSTQQRGKCFIEKTPQHVLHLTFLLRYFSQARFVHIVRDGRDCYCSSRTHPDIPQRTSVQRFARYWRRCVSAPLRYAQNPRVFTIKYEELTQRPDTVVGEIMHFLGVDPEPAQFDPTIYGADPRAKLQEFGRLTTPISASTVGRWKEELSLQEQNEFLALAKEQLAAYGYPSG